MTSTAQTPPPVTPLSQMARLKAETVPTQAWRIPQRLDIVLHPVLPLIAEMLPKALSGFVFDAADERQMIVDYIAVALVVVCASLIGAGCGIRLKRNSEWTEVPVFWGLLIGAPGVMKTEGIKIAKRLLAGLLAQAKTEYEKARSEYDGDVVVYKQKQAFFEKEIANAVHANPSIVASLQAELAAFSEPAKPELRRYWIGDATIQQIADLLAINKRGLLQIRDEIMSLLKKWERNDYAEDKGSASSD